MISSTLHCQVIDEVGSPRATEIRVNPPLRARPFGIYVVWIIYLPTGESGVNYCAEERRLNTLSNSFLKHMNQARNRVGVNFCDVVTPTDFRVTIARGRSKI